MSPGRTRRRFEGRRLGEARIPDLTTVRIPHPGFFLEVLHEMIASVDENVDRFLRTI